MDDFNAPASNKIGITPVFTDFVVNLQIDNVVKILDADIKRLSLIHISEPTRPY